MAEPISFPEANWQRVASEGEQVVAVVPCFIDANQVLTCWQLSPEEIAEVVRTGKIWLGIVGDSTPPAWIQGTTPFPPSFEPTGILGTTESHS